MTAEKIIPSQSDALRQRAEKIAQEKAFQIPEHLESLSIEAAQQMLHELRVHQIELEIQNEELRRAHAELEAARARYFDLYDLAPVGYFTLSDQGLILEANLAAATMIGVARSALVKQPISRFILKEDQDIFYLHRKNLFETGEPQAFELRLVKEDAAPVWVRIDATVAHDADGAPLCRATLIDITERRQIEEKLLNLMRQQELILSSAAEGILGLDLQGNHTFINVAAVKILGYEAEELIGRPSHKIWHHTKPDGSPFPAEECGIYDTYREGTRRNSTEVFWRKDGTCFPVEYASMPIYEKGQLIGAVVTFMDITERKQTEEALRESEQRFMDVLYSSPDAVLLIDSEQFVDCNEAAARMLGYADRNEFLKTHPSELSPPSQPDGRSSFEKANEMMMAALERGFHQFEWAHRRANGEDFPVEVSLTSIVLHGKNVIHCMWRELTERKQAEAERAKLEVQLQQAQKMESVGRLAGGVAHDFNNMLGIILGHTEIAIAQVDPAQPLFANLEQIRMAANRSADLTRQLLAFARKQTIAPRVLDLNETVTDMLKMLRRLIGEDISLTWQPKADLWPVNMDPSQIDQIMANLCVNARDSIPDVGKVTIETGNSAFDEHSCADHAIFVPGEYVVLAVSDDGCGMDKQTLAHIFEPFFTTKDVGKGTGLGLATVYGIVKQNNGFIDVYSEPGQGTTFKIYLPRHVGKAPPVQQESSAVPAAHGRETILLVEDEPAMLEITTIMLENQGYTVLAASTPGEAIRLAGERAGEIHLLMTDVVMPEMNGRDLAKNLPSLYPHLRRLFMSGYTANVIAHHSVLDEGVYFIQKPFSIKELAAKVREALGGF
jgi:two-component system, cell cycle sensor histidine kinase and response regulator CckA